jgi:DNA polymerase III subunit gamma/tau
MGLALYRKYRSRSLSEIVGQKAVTTALSNALKQGNISHAYLFTGPRGVGKTSIARILAYEINKIPYTSDELPIDIIELDAATNNGVESARSLIEKVAIAPVSAKYKIYIFDEVHMLSKQAFNALLKTIEEPPAHVIFILATTEVHLIPETILSRTQHYNFKLLTTKEISKHLSEIAAKESIIIDEKALDLIAKHSGGSLRDALSLLDQIRHSSNTIDESVVRDVLGLPTENVIATIMDALKRNDASELMMILETAHSNGITAAQISHEVLAELRTELVKNSGNSDMIELAHQLLEVKLSSRPDIQLELALLKYILSKNPTLIANTPITPPVITKPKPEIKAKEAPEPKIVVEKEAPAAIVRNADENIWESLLTTLKSSHNTIYSIVRMAKPIIDEGKKLITLEFNFPFHQKRISESKNKQVILDQLESLGYSGYQLNCEVVKKTKNTTDTTVEPFIPSIPTEDENPMLGQIRNVFGAAEVLE